MKTNQLINTHKTGLFSLVIKVSDHIKNCQYECSEISSLKHERECILFLSAVQQFGKYIKGITKFSLFQNNFKSSNFGKNFIYKGIHQKIIYIIQYYKDSRFLGEMAEAGNVK